MIQFFPVTSNIWCLRRPSYLTCSYVVETEMGLVFIDASMDSQGRDIIHALDQLNRKPKDIAVVFLTHWHNDHSSGTAYIEKESGCPIYCHPYEGMKLTQSPDHSLLCKISRLIPEAGPLVLFKGLLKDGPAVQIQKFETVSNGQLLFHQFEVIETPGHTPGHISIYDQKNRALFAGDALAVINNKVRRMAKPVTENLEQAHESMMKLMNYQVDTLCVGHRTALTNAQMPMNDFRKELAQTQWPLLG